VDIVVLDAGGRVLADANDLGRHPALAATLPIELLLWAHIEGVLVGRSDQAMPFEHQISHGGVTKACRFEEGHAALSGLFEIVR